jgi:FkbM family methyltransferase
MSPAALVARKWPFANGSGRILDKFAKGVDLGTGERAVQTTDGFPLHVFADDLIGRHIIMSGKFDRSVVQVLLDRAKAGDVLLDVGANIGYVSACFLARVGESRAICIEPQPGVVELLGRNMLQFEGRAQIHQVALSERPGELRFHIDPDNRGASRVREDGEISVPAIDAAALLRTQPKLDLVKIDVEGHEEPIFRAIEGELKRLRPRAILFENQTGSASPQGVIGAILGRAGYGIFGIDKKLLRTRLVPVRSQKDCRFNDYLAVA